MVIKVYRDVFIDITGMARVLSTAALVPQLGNLRIGVSVHY